MEIVSRTSRKTLDLAVPALFMGITNRANIVPRKDKNISVKTGLNALVVMALQTVTVLYCMLLCNMNREPGSIFVTLLN